MNIANLTDYPQSIQQIAEWHYREWHELYPEKMLSDFERDLEESLNSETIPQTWLLIDADEICGTASLLKHDMTTNIELSPWLANIFIRPDKRGMGLGKYLVAAVMREAAMLRIPTLYLFTEDQRAFYEKLGWSLLKNQIYQGKAVAIMRADLR